MHITRPLTSWLILLTAIAASGACATGQHGTSAPLSAEDAAWDQALDPYGHGISRILQGVLDQPRPHARLVTLCDTHGHRLSGSPELEAAIDWAVATMSAEGHENVRREPVSVPRWLRGAEHAAILAPRFEPMAMLGLGGSVGTPRGGIDAEVITVRSEAELQAAGDRVKGRIVLFNNPMPQWTPENGSCYGHTVRFRLHGARLAAALGASAVLIRSVTAHSLRTPHTGTLIYGDANPRIPAAAISTEDAELITRLQAAGETVRVQLAMGARMGPDGASANAVGELVGRDTPEELVLVSGHIDSWDVGQGAHDDGAGVVMAMETLSTLRRLRMRPRRTIRAVLWTNEENGFAGVKSYVKSHAKELPLHAAAIEADAGGFAPDAFGVHLDDPEAQARAVAQLGAILRRIARVGIMSIRPGSSAPDVGFFHGHGVAALGLYTYGENYFDYHHTEADTVDKVDPEELTRSTAAMVAVAWVLAEMPGRLGDPNPF